MIKLILNKVWWLILTVVGYFVLCSILQLPMATIVYSQIDKEDPVLLGLVTYSVGFLVMIYLTYLKRLRNDPKRREYLTETHRKYGSFKTDCLYTLKTREFQAEAIVMSVVVTVLVIIWCTIPFDEEYMTYESSNVAFLFTALWIALTILAGCLAIGLLMAGRLFIHNRTHRAWIDALEVPEEADEVVELRRKKTALKRNIIFQFIYSLLFFVLYFLNHYAVTFAVVVTPPIFLFTQIHGIIGIVHMRNIDEPYKKYALLQAIAFVVYIGSLLFGVFSPKI